MRVDVVPVAEVAPAMRARRFHLAAAAAALALAACASDPHSSAPIQRGASGSCGSSVTVSRGDTLYAIAERCGTSVSALARENNLRPPYAISPGQRLSMPGPATYTVRRGDNLYRIALAHGMSTQDLAAMNRLRPPYTIYPGQELRVRGEPVIVADRRPDTSPRPTPSPERPAPPPPPPPSAPTSVAFDWPLNGEVIARFGDGERRLDGIRIRARMGEPVRAAAPGEVVYAGNELQGYGELVLIRHADRWVTAYGLNSRIRVAVGDQIAAGQHIADAGASGATDEPALHFEIRRGVQPVDPLDRLPER
jgi:murein DD-endopeptidase MepM/ murein hydrolase activator NlpD